MRAARYSRYGGPEVIQIIDVDEPFVGPGDVLVALRAAGLNPADASVREGNAPVRPLPSGIGREFAGVVLQVGARVVGVAVGDEVIGTSEWVIGERFALRAELTAPKAAALDWAVAASIPVAAQTAYIAFDSQHIGPADTVLISAAAGGVGVIAAQLAVRAGARVIGTAGETNFARLRALGVEPVQYGDGLEQRLLDLAPDGIDVVLDQHGPETIETAIALSVPRDRINSVAGYAEQYGVQYRARTGLNGSLVERITTDIVDGRIIIPIEEIFAFDDIVAAYRRLQRSGRFGKLALAI